jgi:hypothetical protein
MEGLSKCPMIMRKLNPEGVCFTLLSLETLGRCTAKKPCLTVIPIMHLLRMNFLTIFDSCSIMRLILPVKLVLKGSSTCPPKH